MNFQSHIYRFFWSVIALIVIIAGCEPQPQAQKPLPIRLETEPTTKALFILKARAEKAVPLKAIGQCLLEYWIEGKSHKENFPVKLWVNPPLEIYLQGDMAFDPQGIVAGSNGREFWLWIKPKEVSSYWWGRWSPESRLEKLMISPRQVLEALGMVEVGSVKDWSVADKGSISVLIKRDKQGKTVKKIYIHDRRDYLIRRIVYFNENGQVAVIAQLDEYKQVLKDFFVPTAIVISKLAEVGGEGSARIKLRSIKTIKFNDEQRRRLFSRPPPRGFKNIYQLIDGNIIKQPQ